MRVDDENKIFIFISKIVFKCNFEVSTRRVDGVPLPSLVVHQRVDDENKFLLLLEILILNGFF